MPRPLTTEGSTSATKTVGERGNIGAQNPIINGHFSGIMMIIPFYGKDGEGDDKMADFLKTNKAI